MKILAISGGTKNNRNDALAREALMGAAEQGADIEFIHLNDLELKPCTGCNACVASLVTGGTGKCVIKGDDFEWLDEKVMEADGIIFVLPLFIKSAPATFKILEERMFGPSHDIAFATISKGIAKESGTKGPDPRLFDKKVVSFISMGGSDWSARFLEGMNLCAHARLWPVIDEYVFEWAAGIMTEEENIKKCHDVGVRIAQAAMDIDNAKFMGAPGLCPNCNSRNFYYRDERKTFECVVCGVNGELEKDENGYKFTYDEEQTKIAQNCLEGRLKHVSDVARATMATKDEMATEKYKNRMLQYKEFINPSRPGC